MEVPDLNNKIEIIFKKLWNNLFDKSMLTGSKNQFAHNFREYLMGLKVVPVFVSKKFFVLMFSNL